MKALYSATALQAATILVAMASGKNFWRPKFWRKSGDGDHFTVKGRQKVTFEKVSFEHCITYMDTKRYFHIVLYITLCMLMAVIFQLCTKFNEFAVLHLIYKCQLFFNLSVMLFDCESQLT